LESVNKIWTKKRERFMRDLKTPASVTKPEASLPGEETSSHIPIRPLYTPDDLAAWDYDRDVGYPGEFPYTRGV
jgi:methylmalonyl-CoA mutase, N-terminal domain